MEEITGISSEQALGQGDYFYSLPFCGQDCPMLADLVLDPGLEKNYSSPFQREGKNYLFRRIHFREGKWK